MIDHASLAARVDEAARTATAIDQLSQGEPTLTLEDATRIQALSIDRRLARGEALIGLKVGFTSRAKMIQMGVHDLIIGRLTDAMGITDGGETARRRYVHPRAEPEIAFRLKARLEGRVSAMDALAAVDAVAPAIELIDSRYKNFKFSLADVVADNSSSSGFVIGGWAKPSAELDNLGMILSINGRPREIGSSSALLGHPLRCLVEAARLAADAGLALEPGWVVMAGAATAAVALTPGDYIEAQTQGLGRAAFRLGA